MQISIRTACITLTLSALLLCTTVTAQCPPGNWTIRSDLCYQWFTNPEYWFDAEQTCVSHQGHLASIGSDRENRFVGRLSQCTDAWIGRFATNLNRLNESQSYAWTDGSDAARFVKHNFSLIDTVHKPLIRTDGEYWLNSLYHEKYPFVCKVTANMTHTNTTTRCPNGWSVFNNRCYIMPQFEANFNEANFYCRRKSSQLLSVLTESELEHVKRIIFGIDSCEKSLDTVWTGLIKLNPCFPDSGGRELCYQWTDFSGKHLGFPNWENGHPRGSSTTNCATLRGDRLYNDGCYNRHRFVCKMAANNDTDGGGGSMDGVVAAFDFRKGLKNMVDADTFIVRDKFGVPRTARDGACFTYNESDSANHKPFYKIGLPVNFNESILAQSQWTMFLRISITDKEFSFPPVAIGRNPHDDLIEPAFQFILAGYQSYGPGLITAVAFYSPDNSTVRHVYDFDTNSTCGVNWCDVAVSFNNLNPTLFANDHSGINSDLTRTDILQTEFLELQLFLGFSPYRQYSGHGFGQCTRCFGLVRKPLTHMELKDAFAKYCS